MQVGEDFRSGLCLPNPGRVDNEDSSKAGNPLHEENPLWKISKVKGGSEDMSNWKYRFFRGAGLEFPMMLRAVSLS
jgi:hypothetical protein